MAQNVEIKAQIEPSEFDSLRKRAASIATDGPIELVQTDTFFNCPNGRLKLRTFVDSTAELIAYMRPDEEGPKTSDYVRSVCDGKTMLDALTRSLGVIGGVKKQREVFLVNQTRIHLDRVDGLGTFLELEVVLEQSFGPNAVEKGEQIANEILSKLEVDKSCLISGAYLDLLLKQTE